MAQLADALGSNPRDRGSNPFRPTKHTWLSWLERSVDIAEAVGSNPTACTSPVSSAARAPALHAGRQEFESLTGHHATFGYRKAGCLSSSKAGVRIP